MKQSRDLYLLINSLTKAEKRNFKLTSSGNAVQIKLFDFICTQEGCNDELIKTRFKDEKFVIQLTSTKYALFHSILDSLTKLYLEDDEYNSLNVAIHKSKILFKKGLYHVALNIIYKNIQIAESLELFSDKIQLMEWEEKLINQNTGNALSIEELYARKTQKEQVNIKFQNLSKAQFYRFFTYQLIINKRQNIKETISTDELIKEIEDLEPLSIRARAEKKYALGTVYFYNDQKQKAFTAYKQLFNLIVSTSFLREDIINYDPVKIFQNMIAAALTRQSLNEDLKLLFDQAYQNAINAKSYLGILRLELAYLISQKKFTEALTLVQKNESKLNSMQELEPLLMGDLFYGIILTYFWNNKWHILLRQINNALVFNELKIDNDIKQAVRFVEIFTHLENKNNKLAERKSLELLNDIINNKSNFTDSVFILEYVNQVIKNLKLRKNKATVALPSFSNSYYLEKFIDCETYLKNKSW